MGRLFLIGVMELREQKRGLVVVFFNQQHHLRAGWRIGIFLALLIGLSLGLVVPILLVSLDFAYPAIGVTVAVCTFVVLKMVDKRPFISVGLALHSRIWIEILQGFIVAAVQVTIVVLIQIPAGYLTFSWNPLSPTNIISTFALQFAFFLMVAFTEELFFRGYIFQTLIDGTNTVIALIVMSTGFGVAHFFNPNATVLGTINIVLVGIWFSIAYLRTRSLWMPIAFHFSWNFFLGYVFSLPVSGLNTPDHLFTVHQVGPEWLTGGAFGPEGGALATAVLTIGTVYIASTRSIWIGRGVWVKENVTTVSTNDNIRTA
jgi:membrane protease YdiL (CAAX protease family)